MLSPKALFPKVGQVTLFSGPHHCLSWVQSQPDCCGLYDGTNDLHPPHFFLQNLGYKHDVYLGISVNLAGEVLLDAA